MFKFGVPRCWLLAAVVVATMATPGAAPCHADADAVCDPQQTERIVRALGNEAVAADQWGVTWASIFGAAAITQAGFAVGSLNPLGPNHDRSDLANYIGASKAMIGFLARTITPLRVATVSAAQLAAAPNDCARAQLAYAALRKTAQREKRAFFLSHGGGIALHLVGAAILLRNHAPTEALWSFAIGYPVGLLHNYLMPRTSWHLSNQVQAPRITWTIAPMVSETSTGLAAMGTF
ncbi:MAG: hypothetical protein KBG15_14155 [Kofleriaceae bacterium]|nr:hypothetical protein [Kofleriaceae bacterium]